MANIHTLFPQKVYLDEEQHRYFDNDGKEYLSFSKFFEFLSAKADFDSIAGFVANRDGETKENVKAKWKAQTDEGTRVDKALERYAQTGQILVEDTDLEPLIKTVIKKYGVYNKCYEQVVVYNENTRTCGMLDKLCLLSNRKDSKFHMGDFKCFEGGMGYEPKGQAWLNYPLSHLPNSKYIKICLQLSFYSWHYEKLTNMKCEAQFIDLIIPVKKDGKVVAYKNSVIHAPYLKLEIELLLNTFQPQILSSIEGNLQPAF